MGREIRLRCAFKENNGGLHLTESNHQIGRTNKRLRDELVIFFSFGLCKHLLCLDQGLLELLLTFEFVDFRKDGIGWNCLCGLLRIAGNFSSFRVQRYYNE